MYARGMSARENVGHLRELYGIEVSPYLGQGLLQIVEQAIGIKGGLAIGAGQKLVQERVRNAGCLASCHRRPRSGPLGRPAHEFLTLPFVPKAAVEALDEAILHRLAGAI